MAVVPLQRPGRSKQDYATSERFLRAVKRRLNITSFVVDLAADDSNTCAPLFYDAKTDALKQHHWEQWCTNGWGWLNPPFGTIAPWARRCQETKDAGGSIAFLIPASVGANWFRDYVDGEARILLLNGRLHFLPDKPNWLYPKDCVLALYSPAVVPGYEVWNWQQGV